MAKLISYAQNFEDVVLWRALQSVSCGFYIDVGANHPVFDSVTKAFYERGWHGINIEPLQSHYNQLKADRPRDTNLRCALSSTAGQTTFYEVEGTGLSTLEAAIAETHAASGYTVRTYDVPLMTLAEVCTQYDVNIIHFLKIDVEGAEEKVLKGMPLECLRPWIVVVEATQPNTQIPSHRQWEPLLLNQGYQFVYFDGANRFYLSAEHTDLAAAFRVPPNVFDNFIQYPYWLCQQDNIALREELGNTQRRLAEIRSSWSWKLGKPLRGMAYLLRMLFSKGK